MLLTVLRIRHIDTDPDADPDPTFHFYADPAYHFCTDTDPDADYGSYLSL